MAKVESNCFNCGRDLTQVGAVNVYCDVRVGTSGDIEDGVVHIYDHRKLSGRLPAEPYELEREIVYVECDGCGWTLVVPHEEFDSDSDEVLDADEVESEYHRR